MMVGINKFITVLFSAVIIAGWGTEHTAVTANGTSHGLDAPEYSLIAVSSLAGAETPLSWQEWCIVCDPECGGGGLNYHELPESGQGFGIEVVPPGEPHWDECWDSGTCDRWHPVGCYDTEEALPDLIVLWDGLKTGMVMTDVASLVKSHPGIIELNVNRSAIQVIGCNGGIMAHIPIDRESVALLDHALQQ
ncbi:MAG: hypothetical protein WEA24_05865 [Gemmatimonadota bacterium]